MRRKSGGAGGRFKNLRGAETFDLRRDESQRRSYRPTGERTFLSVAVKGANLEEVAELHRGDESAGIKDIVIDARRQDRQAGFSG